MSRKKLSIVKQTAANHQSRSCILTVNVQRYPLADRGWYTIAGYAEVNAGLPSVEPPKFQVVTDVHIFCQQKNNCDNNNIISLEPVKKDYNNNNNNYNVVGSNKDDNYYLQFQNCKRV